MWDINQVSCQLQDMKKKPGFSALEKQTEQGYFQDANTEITQTEVLANCAKSAIQRTSKVVLRRLAEGVAESLLETPVSNECALTTSSVCIPAIPSGSTCQTTVVSQYKDFRLLELSLSDSAATAVETGIKVERKKITQTLKSKKCSNYFSKFNLPTRSTHSARIITPNKRFLDIDECFTGRKKLKLLPKDVSPPASSAVLMELPCSRVNVSKSTSFDKAKNEDLLTSGSISSDSMQAVSVTSDLRDLPTLTMKTGGVTHKLNCDDHLPVCSALQLNIMQDQKSVMAEESRNLNIPETNGVVSSTGSILHKPKLQLNQAAINRSKAALARSLRRQMAKEKKLKMDLSLGDEYLESEPTYVGTMQRSVHCTPPSTCLTATGETACFSSLVKSSGIHVIYLALSLYKYFITYMYGIS